MSLHEHEWPGDVLDHMTRSIVITAQEVRSESGVPMIPSPVEGAHVRFEDGTSRHAVGVSGTLRKSDATDLYLVDNADAGKLWQAAQRVNSVGGFGLYFDTVYDGEPRVMFHIDNRNPRLLWVCPARDRATQKRTYIYYRPNNPGPYLDTLAAELEKLRHV